MKVSLWMTLFMLLAFGFCAYISGCSTFDNNNGDDAGNSDDDTDDDTDECADNHPPVWDFHGICYATPQGINFSTCITTNPATKDAPLGEMYDQNTQEGWGVFIRYSDEDCNLVIPESAECGTGEEGIFLSWNKSALETECNFNPDSTIELNDSLLLSDQCGATSEVWEFTINVICP